MTMALCMMIAYGCGALLALGFRGRIARWVAAAGAGAGGLGGIAAAVSVILSGRSVSWSLAGSDPMPALSFCLDPLGAFFLLLIGIVALPAAIYAIGYGDHGQPATSNRMPACLFNLFLLSMSLVVMASGVFTFLVFWEGMSLTSYFLVISEDQEAETLSAGAWYAGMAHAGFGLIAIALLLMVTHAPGMLFEEIRGAALGPGLKNAVFILSLLGFGSKAGLIPLHVWLPKAHPAAPSPVSALMSGVMVKLGIYGIIRVSLDLLGGGPSWWGALVLTVGAVSALIGVLYALMGRDLKRLLAYSTVENVGLIAMGVGLALIFRSYGFATLANLSLVAALFHALNHSAFKGLLFLGAGSVLHATGSRNMEKMGGLIHRMPVTAACFLVGSAAISGLPPLNGFASEWMLFQSLLAGVRIPHTLVAAIMAIAVGVLALTAGLAAACFVKAFGISFLAMPRSQAATECREVPRTMQLGMGFLAALCVLIGILPSLVVPLLARAVSGLPGVDAPSAKFSLGLLMAVPGQSPRISPTWLAVLLLMVVGGIPIVFRMLRVNLKLRSGETWGCGRVTQTARMEYTSTAFAEPLRRVFGALYRPTQDVTIDFHPDSKYFVQSILYRSAVRTWFEEYLYQPLGRWVQWIGSSGRWIQTGSVHRYIGYIFLALLVFLLMARWF
jgi:hydrogenase-4 component B